MIGYKNYRKIKEGSILERANLYYVVLGELFESNHIVTLEYNPNNSNSKNICIIGLIELIQDFKYIDELQENIDRLILKLKLSLINDTFLYVLDNLDKVSKYPLFKEYKNIEYLNGYYGYISFNGDLLTTSNIDRLFVNLDCLASISLYTLKLQDRITDNLLVTKGRGNIKIP